jgi:membrane fusion protein (multidrug efflux system)
MKPLQIALGSLLGVALLAGGWITIFHAEWIKPHAHEDDEEKVETVVPVHTGQVKTITFHRYVEGWGNVAAEPAHDGLAAASARVASPTLGVLAEAHCAEGQHVEKGATLFQLDLRMASAEAQKATAARASAKAVIDRLSASVEFNQRELERTKKLTEEKLTSEKDLRAAELTLLTSQKELTEANARVFEADKTAQAAQTQATLLRILSPLAGTVVKVNVNPGEAIEAATVLAEIVDLDRLVVTATIPAAELRSLKVGVPVEILPGGEAKANDEEPVVLMGQLAFLGFQVDPRNDTVSVRVAIPKDAGLRPGQYVRVRVVVEQHDDRLAVPKQSVFKTDEGSLIAVVEGDKATQRAVQIGLKENGLVEVSGEGLKAGMTVVTAGAYALPKETKIRVIGE